MPYVSTICFYFHQLIENIDLINTTDCYYLKKVTKQHKWLQLDHDHGY